MFYSPSNVLAIINNVEAMLHDIKSRVARIGKKLEALITQEGAEIVKYEDTFLNKKYSRLAS